MKRIILPSFESMKKYTFVCAVFAATLLFTSCGTSKESAYRKAYEKAKAQEMAQQQGQQAYGQQQQQYVQQDPSQYQQQVQQYQQPMQQQVPQYQQPSQQQTVQQQAPTVTQLAPPTTTQETATASVVTNNVNTNTVSSTSSANTVGNGNLKAFSVVVGAFGVRANAEGLQNTLRNAGYGGAQVIYDGKMYRVIASTHDSREAAQKDQNALKAQYSGAWIMAK
jgi:cell division protein FtsN